MKLITAINELRKQLKADPELWNVYQANIAMAFYDEYKRYEERHRKRIKMKGLTTDELHGMSNQAANNFLQSFID